MSSNQTAVIEETATARKRVLVVDDEPVIRALIAASFDGSGVDVSLAEDGAGALLAVVRETPDLVLLDVSMPGLSGVEVLGRLRADASTARIPVVLLTGLEPPSDVAPDAVLRKPFTLTSLRASVATFLE